MALSSFEASLARLLKDEGGYTNHPSDPGGPTNFGITLADARRYWKADATAADVKAMDIGIAKSIYRVRYWDAQQCSNLPPGVDYAIFDYGVNSGVGRSGKVLRRCLGLPDNTWQVTPQVVAAALAADPVKLCNMIWSERLAFLKSLKTWPVFGKGWTNRVVGGKAFSQTLIAKGGKAPPAPAPSSATPAGKGQVPVNTTAQGGAAGGSVVTGTTTATAAAQSGAPWWVVALIIVGTVAVAAGTIWFFKYRRRKAQEAPVAFKVGE